VQEQAKALAARVRANGDPAKRIDSLYLLALGRRPTSDELTLGLSFTREAGHSAQPVWEQYAQVLLLSNEFMFVD